MAAHHVAAGVAGIVPLLVGLGNVSCLEPYEAAKNPTQLKAVSCVPNLSHSAVGLVPVVLNFVLLQINSVTFVAVQGPDLRRLAQAILLSTTPSGLPPPHLSDGDSYGSGQQAISARQ